MISKVAIVLAIVSIAKAQYSNKNEGGQQQQYQKYEGGATSYQTVIRHDSSKYAGAPAPSYQSAPAQQAYQSAPTQAYHAAPAQPAYQSTQLAYQAAQPAYQAAQPAYQAAQPAYQASQSAYQPAAQADVYVQSAPAKQSYSSGGYEEKYDYAPAQYSFKYGVEDHKTGDIKHHYEERNGDVVHGEYSLVQPDGITRTVKYTADKKNGFQAQVTYSGYSKHPEYSNKGAAAPAYH